MYNNNKNLSTTKSKWYLLNHHPTANNNRGTGLKRKQQGIEADKIEAGKIASTAKITLSFKVEQPEFFIVLGWCISRTNINRQKRF